MNHPFLTPWDTEGTFEDSKIDEEFRLRFGKFQQQIEEGLTKLSAASNIRMAMQSEDGEPYETNVQEVLSPQETEGELAIVPAGMCCGFDGTIKAARALRGWAVRDGDQGTTDVRGCFPRWASKDEDAGETGGGATHIHDAHTTAQVAIAIADHPAHDHAVSLTSGANSADQDCLARTGSDCAAAAWHTHAVSGDTEEKVAMEHLAEPGDGLEHAPGANVPPYITDIPMMKL